MQRFKAISHTHKLAGLESPVEESLRRAIRELRREEGSHGNLPLSTSLLRDASIRLRVHDTPVCTRDRAILLLEYAIAALPEEIVALDAEDIISAAPGGLALWMPSNRFRAHERGRIVTIEYAVDRAMCPVTALYAWLEHRGPGPGPLFLRLDTRTIGRRLAAAGVRRALQHGIELAGKDPTQYDAHSLRACAIAAAIRSGMSDSLILHRTGLRSLDRHRKLPGAIRNSLAAVS